MLSRWEGNTRKQSETILQKKLKTEEKPKVETLEGFEGDSNEVATWCY